MTIAAIALLAAATAPPAAVLTLAEAERTALVAQPELRAAHAQTVAAGARADEAASGLYPQVVANASYQRATSNFVARPSSTPSNARGASTSFRTYDFFNFGVTATQLIYDFGQTSGKWRAAQESAASQEANERSTRLTVVANVRLAFLGARAQKELVKVADETLANQQRHLEQVQGFVDARARPEIDLAQARLDVANARVAQVTAENGYATAKAQLNQAMGTPRGTEYDVADETVAQVAGEDASVESLLPEAEQARPEVAAMRHQIEAQRRTIGVAQAGYGPTLAVSTGATAAGPTPDNLAPNWNAQVTLSWPLFAGMVTPAAVREARASLTTVEAQYQSLALQIRLGLEQALLGVRAAKAALDASHDALTNADERLRLAEGRYAAGAGSIIELGDAQVAHTSAAAQVVQAEYALATARVQLALAMGRM